MQTLQRDFEREIRRLLILFILWNEFTIIVPLKLLMVNNWSVIVLCSLTTITWSILTRIKLVQQWKIVDALHKELKKRGNEN